MGILLKNGTKGYRYLRDKLYAGGSSIPLSCKPGGWINPIPAHFKAPKVGSSSDSAEKFKGTLYFPTDLNNKTSLSLCRSVILNSINFLLS